MTSSTSRVRTGHEKLESRGILWFHFLVLESHGIKVGVMESHGKWRWLYKMNYLGSFFLQNKVQSNRNQDDGWGNFYENGQFSSWKTLKSHEKGRGKSWNFKSLKEYEPEPSFASFVTQSNFAFVLFDTQFSLIVWCKEKIAWRPKWRLQRRVCRKLR